MKREPPLEYLAGGFEVVVVGLPVSSGWRAGCFQRQIGRWPRTGGAKDQL